MTYKPDMFDLDGLDQNLAELTSMDNYQTRFAAVHAAYKAVGLDGEANSEDKRPSPIRSCMSDPSVTTSERTDYNSANSDQEVEEEVEGLGYMADPKLFVKMPEETSGSLGNFKLVLGELQTERQYNTIKKGIYKLLHLSKSLTNENLGDITISFEYHIKNKATNQLDDTLSDETLQPPSPIKIPDLNLSSEIMESLGESLVPSKKTSSTLDTTSWIAQHPFTKRLKTGVRIAAFDVDEDALFINLRTEGFTLLDIESDFGEKDNIPDTFKNFMLSLIEASDNFYVYESTYNIYSIE